MWIKASQIVRVDANFLSLHLVLSEGWEFFCERAVDYSIRPPHPGIIMGGPLISLHEQHPRLENWCLQLVPGGDGEEFDPPLALKLLEIDQSWVIAETFEVDRSDDLPW